MSSRAATECVNRCGPRSLRFHTARSFSSRPGTTYLKRRSSMRRPCFSILHCMRVACIHLAEDVHLTTHWTWSQYLRCHISRSFPKIVGIERSEWSDKRIPPSHSDASSIMREHKHSSGPRCWSIRMCSSARNPNSQLINQA
jgi:hypothetical protein